jgi:hypothetical protein
VTTPASTVDVRRQWAIAVQQYKAAKHPRARQLALRRCDIVLDRYNARRQN